MESTFATNGFHVHGLVQILSCVNGARCVNLPEGEHDASTALRSRSKSSTRPPKRCGADADPANTHATTSSVERTCHSPPPTNTVRGAPNPAPVTTSFSPLGVP